MDYTVLQEWLDENSHRQFPLDDTASGIDATGSFTLPTTFMVDMFLAVPLTADVTKFFVKNIVVSSCFSEVTIGYKKPDLSEISVGKFSRLPASQSQYAVYPFEPSTQAITSDLPFTTMTGALVINTFDDIITKPGSWAFTYAAGKILSTRISQGLAALRSFTVGTQLFTGNIILKEGSNVTLTPSYDAGTDTTTITVSANIGAMDDLAIPLTNDASVLANLIATYGTPMTSLNGVKPDASGDFTLQELDCTSLTGITGGISIANPCAQPCCDKSMLQTAYDDIAQLNLRYSRLEAYYESISRNTNELQARMVALEL